MHFPEFQGSGLTWTEFPETFHLRGIQLTSRRTALSAKTEQT